MNAKKSNWLFLCIIVSYIGVIEIFGYLDLFSKMPMELASAFPEILIMIPALLFLICNGKNANRTMNFHRIRFSNYLLLILYVILLLPLVSCANIFSQIFVENVVAESSDTFYEIGFLKTFLLVGVIPPLCEEFVFRGAIYGGYRQPRATILGIVMSSLLFGLLHMNLNQAPYAFLIGVMICLAYEATGSIFAGMFIHFLINGGNVAMLFLVDQVDGQMLDEAKDMLVEMENQKVYYAHMAGQMFLVSVVTIPLAICVLHFIAKRSNRSDALLSLWEGRKEKSHQIITVPLILALIINVGYIILAMSIG